MPEGNEVHRWAERHTEAFVGKKLRVDAPNGRFQGSEMLDGRALEEVRAVGKHLGYVFGKDRILHIHLGRFGDFSEGVMPLLPERGMLRMRMWRADRPRVRNSGPGAPPRVQGRGDYRDDDGTMNIAPERVEWVELRGPPDCSVYDEAKWAALLKRLGPDPLNGDKPDTAIEKIGKAKKPIAVLLMEQDILSGIGNIYRAELLYRARLSPFREGNAVPEAVLRAIWKDAKPLLKAGMVDRRIVTTRAKDRPHRALKPPLREEVHYVYRRAGKPCWVCGTAVNKMDMAGRTLYWCPVCQAG